MKTKDKYKMSLSSSAPNRTPTPSGRGPEGGHEGHPYAALEVSESNEDALLIQPEAK
jgi:hypothetical protein